MREGVAVVEYSCEGIRLLKDCHIEGSYGFIGMTRKEQVVRLQNADEVRANLPLSGAKVGAELARGSSLDIAMVLVGQTKTTWTEPTKADLVGKCEGATHFVRGALVGAFATAVGSHAKARAAAEIFGAGVSGGSSSEKEVRNKEGEIGACGAANPDSDSPPAQCGAPVRLVLDVIKTGEVAPASEEQGPAIVAAASACPQGLVRVEGKCAAAASAPAFQCDGEKVADCEEQCKRGHAGSCGTLGALLASGRNGATRDPARAVEVLKKGCDGDDTPSCLSLGSLTADGIGTAKDPAAAAPLFEKACNGGEAVGCRLLGQAHLLGAGVSADPAAAAKLLERGCDGGDDKSCGAIGSLYARGEGVARDTSKASEFLRRACHGTDAASCVELGVMHETGDGAAKTPALAQVFYQRACALGFGDGCTNLGRLQLAAGTDEKTARRNLDVGCMRRSTVGCAILKAVFGESKPVIPDMRAEEALRRSCMAGSSRDCTTAGILQVAAGNKPGGLMNLRQACTRGDKLACDIAKRIEP